MSIQEMLLLFRKYFCCSGIVMIIQEILLLFRKCYCCPGKEHLNIFSNFFLEKLVFEEI